MSAKKVDFDRLAAALPDYPFAYLVTVDDAYRAHTVAVEPILRRLNRRPHRRAHRSRDLPPGPARRVGGRRQRTPAARHRAPHRC